MRNDTTYYEVRYKRGHPRAGQTEKVTEPIARTLIDNGMAEAMDKLPPQTRLSHAGTKTIDAAKVAAKAG